MHRTLLTTLALGFSLVTALAQPNSLSLPPIVDGPFKADWSSLTNYQTPDWFRDAKFAIWAHWGPQCQPEHGDWYARSMYEEGSGNSQHNSFPASALYTTFSSQFNSAVSNSITWFPT